MKNLVLVMLVMLGMAGVASATDCHQNVQAVQSYYVAPAREVRFVEVAPVRHVRVQKQEVEYVPASRVIVREVRNDHHHNNQQNVRVEKVIVREERGRRVEKETQIRAPFVRINKRTVR